MPSFISKCFLGDHGYLEKLTERLAPQHTERGRKQQIYTEYVLYEADVPITGMLSDSYIDDAADHADDEKPPEVPTTADTRNTLHLLLHNEEECIGSE